MEISGVLLSTYLSPGFMIWAAAQCTQRSADGQVEGGEVCPLSHRPSWCGCCLPDCKAPAARLPLHFHPRTRIRILNFVGEYPTTWVTGRGCLGRGIIQEKGSHPLSYHPTNTSLEMSYAKSASRPVCSRATAALLSPINLSVLRSSCTL